MSLTIVNNTKIKINKSTLGQIIKKALNILNMKKYSLNILFITDSEIKKLNRKYRNIDKATDVLSFSLLEGLYSNINPCYEMGDIVISAETARRRADSEQTSLTDEISKLAIHGILHIAGFDHHSKKETIKMRSMEKILSASTGRD